MVERMSISWKCLVFLTCAIYASAQNSTDCGKPPTHVYAKPASNYDNKLTFGDLDKVYYICAEDYVPSKGKTAVQCVNGTWTTLTLKCEKWHCGNAGELLNGKFMYEGTSVGEKVSAVCNEGYTLKGSPFMICKHSGWTGEFPSCEVIPAKHTCLNPVVANGLKSSADVSVYQVGDTVTFICNQGFHIDGSQQATCGPDGQWQPLLPKCLLSNEMTCKDPKAQRLNRFTVISGLKPIYKSGDTLSFLCNKPYSLNGSSTATCGLDGDWSPPLPKCILVKCPELNVSNGRHSSMHRRVNTTITVSCVMGYKLNGPSKVVCLQNGHWSEIPKCLSGGCGVPSKPNNSNSHLADRYITKTSFASGDEVHYVCAIGYISVRGSRYRKCMNGKWSPLLLKCERRTCGSAGEIANGDFLYTGVEFGDTASAVCDEGHKLVGRGTRTCLTNGWDNRVPRCEAIQCTDPPEVMNADRIGGTEPPYMYREVVIYRCRSGNLIGNRELWCTENGTWSSPPPICKDITCPLPNVPNSSRIGPTHLTYKYRDNVSFECNRGYERIGSSSVTCGVDGKWSPKLPICRRRVYPRRH